MEPVRFVQVGEEWVGYRVMGDVSERAILYLPTLASNVDYVLGTTEQQLFLSGWQSSPRLSSIDAAQACATGPREQLLRFRGRELNTRGDDFLATFDGPARGVRCAPAISATAADLDIAVRSGLHTGEVELMNDDVAGIAVHIGARVAALAQPAEVVVSRTSSIWSPDRPLLSRIATNTT